MAIITINGRDIEFGEQESLNLIQAAQRAGIEIPHYCWHPALSVVASCRMCLVEVGEKRADGSVAMQPRLVPACQTPARHGTVVITNSPKVRAAQAATLEFLLLNHPLDCPVCDQAGECWLQDYSYKYGRSRSRLRDEKLIRPDKDYIGEQIVLFTDRCIMCTRCVRFTREISGTAELQVIRRGDHAEIDVFPGKPCNNKLAGNVVDICPVGALCSKDFLYKQRVWFLKQQKSVCPHCSTGCSVWIDWNKNIVYRIRPRYNPQVNGHFICDDGRLGYHHINSNERLRLPMQRQGSAWVPTSWPEWKRAFLAYLERISHQDGGNSLALILSPWLTLEETWLAIQVVKSSCPESRLIMGPVRDSGADDLYPKGPRGEPPLRERAKFIIHGEKAPNRKGVELLVRHFQNETLTWHQGMNMIANGTVRDVIFIDADPIYHLSDEEIRTLGQLNTFIAWSLFKKNGLDVIPHWLIPATSFAEKSGTYVNCQGVAQLLRPAITPYANIWPEARFLWEVLGRAGLFQPALIRREMAMAIATLKPLACDDLGEYGIHLNI
jgi:NADH-quinone oxidoreductase subunit G